MPLGKEQPKGCTLNLAAFSVRPLCSRCLCGDKRRSKAHHRDTADTEEAQSFKRDTRPESRNKEMKANDEQPKSFEASLEALEEIVQSLENGDLPLEKSLELFEEGIRLSRQCQERLSQAERRIEILLRDNQGRPVVSAFEDANAIAENGSKDG